MAEYQSLNQSSPSPSSNKSADPFYVVKDKVRTLISSTTTDFDAWKSLLHTTNTHTNAKFHALHNRLKTNLKQLDVDLNDLSQTIAIVEANRSRFPDIDESELHSRRVFVTDMKALVEDIQDTLVEARTKKKMESDERESKKSGVSGVSVAEKSKFSSGSAKKGKGASGGTSGSAYVDHKQQEQLLLERNQDVVLDDMTAALSRLTDITGDIHNELNVHNELLGELDAEIDDTQLQMSTVQKKIEKLLGTSDKGRLCCIFLLMLIVVILLALIIYT